MVKKMVRTEKQRRLAQRGYSKKCRDKKKHELEKVKQELKEAKRRAEKAERELKKLREKEQARKDRHARKQKEWRKANAERDKAKAALRDAPPVQIQREAEDDERKLAVVVVEDAEEPEPYVHFWGLSRVVRGLLSK